MDVTVPRKNKRTPRKNLFGIAKATKFLFFTSLFAVNILTLAVVYQQTRVLEELGAGGGLINPDTGLVVPRKLLPSPSAHGLDDGWQGGTASVSVDESGGAEGDRPNP